MAETLRRLPAEFPGSLFLAGVVIGSGILAVEVSGGNDGVALIGSRAVTGAATLWVLVAPLEPVAGAHFNPAMTLAFGLRGEIGPVLGILQMISQILGCVPGGLIAHAMFELPLIQIASTDRSGGAQILARGVATFALVFAIFGAIRHAPKAVPAAVALVIMAGYWWTASTRFANPAITVARAVTGTFAGIRPADVPGFFAGQFLDAALATEVCAVLFRSAKQED